MVKSTNCTRHDMFTTAIITALCINRQRIAHTVRRRLRAMQASFSSSSVLGPVFLLTITCTIALYVVFFRGASAVPAQSGVHLPSVSFLRRTHPRFQNFTVVTFGSMSFYDNLENAIGSVHYWAPGIPVAVYDLGLSAVQRAKLGCFLGVSVLDFDFSSYPPHVRDLYTYSWKPILYRDATLRFGKVLLIDSGIEVRTPLDYVFEAIDTTGYFFVQATTAFDYMGKMVHPGMLSYLQVPRSLVEGRQMCYAGMHGYRADSDIVQNVLEPTVECMMHAECVDPPGAGHDNHRYEQAAFSIFMRKHGIYCHDEDRFREDKPMLASWDPTQEHQDFTFFFRRWRYPKPYTHLISRSAECGPRKVMYVYGRLYCVCCHYLPHLLALAIPPPHPLPRTLRRSRAYGLACDGDGFSL